MKHDDYEPGECRCHREYHPTHEPCCGYSGGRNPNCPRHGDGTTDD